MGLSAGGGLRTLLFIGWLSCQQASAQGELGLFAGVSNYQGDLPSYSTADGLRVMLGPVFGGHFGYALSPSFHLRHQLLYTRISGDDALAESPDVRQRNLHFFAPLVQLSTGMEWYPFRFDAEGSKGLSPYVGVGASVFYFNPRTRYEGRKVSLQPLGTEGQYLSAYPDQTPYSRIQPGLIFAGGLKLPLADAWILTAEAVLTYTFTDYLDDVSTIYISYEELLDQAGPLTAALANRQGEFLGTEPVSTPTGSLRANPDTRDFFGMITLRLSRPIHIGADRHKVRMHNNKKMRCPRF